MQKIITFSLIAAIAILSFLYYNQYKSSKKLSQQLDSTKELLQISNSIITQKSAEYDSIVSENFNTLYTLDSLSYLLHVDYITQVDKVTTNINKIRNEKFNYVIVNDSIANVLNRAIRDTVKVY